MDDRKVSLEDIKRAMNDPAVRSAGPDHLIENLSSALGIDVEAVSQDETEEVRRIYFQAIRLEADNWTDMPGVGPMKGTTTYVQISPFKLRRIPENTSMVADVLIDKSDYEVECFENYIQGMTARGKSLVFYANASIPVDIVLGLKCVDAEGNPVFVPDECYRKKSG